LPLGVPDTIGKQAIDIGQRAVAVDEEPEAFAVRFSGPFAVPRLPARVVRIEPDAAQCLPATVRAPLNVAAVLVLLADTGTAVGTGFRRARTCHLSPRPGLHLTARWVVCSFVVKVIRGAPADNDSLLRVADVEQSVAHQIAQYRFQPILGFGISFRFDAAAWLWPEVRHVIAAAKANGHKVVDFIIGMRSRW